MTLDDLLEEVESAESEIEEFKPLKKGVKVVDATVLPEEEFDDEDIEEQYLQSLALLEDCLCVLEEIIDPTQSVITQAIMNRAEAAALEARGWLMLHGDVK